MAGGGQGVLAGIFLIFVATQSGYFLLNVLAVVFLYTRRKNVVPEEDPETYRHVNVLLPVYREPRSVVEGTLESIFATEYPREHLSVYLIYETGDPRVTDYLDSLRYAAHRNGTDFQAIGVDRESFVWDAPGAAWLDTDDEDPLPRTKATALRYAFRTGAFLPDDVVTVFDADTHVPQDFFHRGVRGLEDYDIVQAKQTVRNRGDGWLPRLEAMGIAAWSDIVYPRTSRGPYQLLGKGYFASAATLDTIDDWQPAAITEDMQLGLDAYERGYSLGIIDRYVGDLCPASFSPWLRQKTRWVAGPYRTWRTADLSAMDSLRFLFYAGINQSVSLLNVLGLPAGLAMILLTIVGLGPAYPLWLAVIVTANLVGWTYYSLLSYRAAARAITFESRRDQLVYFLVSNPITQALYATIWTAPILNVAAHVLKREPITFGVTSKTE